MTTLNERSVVYLDALGAPQPQPCENDWHLIRATLTPTLTACVCPSCWPSYSEQLARQSWHFGSDGRRQSSVQVSRVSAAHASRYRCTICSEVSL